MLQVNLQPAAHSKHAYLKALSNLVHWAWPCSLSMRLHYHEAVGPDKGMNRRSRCAAMVLCHQFEADEPRRCLHVPKGVYSHEPCTAVVFVIIVLHLKVSAHQTDHQLRFH